MPAKPHRSLTPENLLADLGPSRESTWRLMRALRGALVSSRHRGEVRRCFGQWRELFCRSSDWATWSRNLGTTRPFVALCESMGATSKDPEVALFSLHTYYALVVKLVCAVTLDARPAPLEGRQLWERLEDGSTFRKLGVEDLVSGEDCFAWYLAAQSTPLQRELEELWRRVQRYRHDSAEREKENRSGAPGAWSLEPGASVDLLKPLYLALLPRQVRHRLGEFYTPDWLAERLLELTMGRDLGDPRRAVLDPACGSGTFLTLAVCRARARARAEGVDDRDALASILANITGQDLNPLAVLAARANYLLALGPLLGARRGCLRLPVRLGDAVLDPPSREGGHDFVVGNPPWINWEHLPTDYRQQTRALWGRYGLFPHRGMDAILGKGKKDISMLLTCVALERCVRPGGRLGFVLPQGLFKTAGAGEGFRRFCLPGEVPFAVELVEDFCRIKVFEGASTRPVIALLRRDQAAAYPVPYEVWPKPGPVGGAEPLRWHAEPVDPKRPASPWLTVRPGALGALRRVLGPSPYVAHEGANTGGANAVYWVEGVKPGTNKEQRARRCRIPECPEGARTGVPRSVKNREFRTGERGVGLVVVANVLRGARKKVPQVQASVEAERLFPLLRGRDVSRWQAEPSLQIVMAQDPQTRRGITEEVMTREFPATAKYLARFQKMLAARPAFLRYFRPERDAYWSMFNVGEYTFAPFKVVWREQASGFTAAVAPPGKGKPAVPDHKLMLVEVASLGEAHYLCAALNCAPVRLAVAAYAVSIQMSTHILRHVAVPRYSSGDATHRALSKISVRAHQAARDHDLTALAHAERSLDQRAGLLWGLSDRQMGQIHAALDEQP